LGNPLLGLGLGLVTGTLLAGACVWSLHIYGGMSGLFVLHHSVVAPVVLAFFETVMAFTQRFFPRTEPAQVPWWKRPLW